MKKKTIMPKAIYDKYMKDVNNGFALHPFKISQITVPYNGQLAVDDENDLYMYRNGEWLYVELPKYINLVGKCVFGDFITYYIYWINYQHPEYYSGSYMLTTVPIIDESDWKEYAIAGDHKIHDFVCEYANETIRFGGTVVFTKSADEAIMQACIKAEQYKYNLIAGVVKQFENISCEFIPQEEMENEN